MYLGYMQIPYPAIEGTWASINFDAQRVSSPPDAEGKYTHKTKEWCTGLLLAQALPISGMQLEADREMNDKNNFHACSALVPFHAFIVCWICHMP